MSCGAGGMIVAMEEAMLETGFNPQKQMMVYCVDIVPVPAMMCYIQKLAYKPAAPVFSDSCSLSREGAGKLEAIRILTCDSRLSASLRITP